MDIKGSLTITRGLPGCGKTTYAMDWLQGNVSFNRRVNRDDLRASLFSSYAPVLSSEDENYVTKVQQNMIKHFLAEGLNVIVDDTNLPDRRVRDFMALAQEFEAEFVIKDFRDVPLETCITRDAFRAAGGGRFVGADVIRNMHTRFIKGQKLNRPIKLSEVKVAPVFKPYVADTSKPMAVTVDMDGTLAKIGDRSPYDAANAHLDTVNGPMGWLTNILYSNTTVIILTGRQGEHLEVTKQWLSDNGIGYDLIFSRAEGDSRSDDVIKDEIFEREIAPFYNVVAAIDDRPKVCRMWREKGIFTFQVGDPHFEF